MLVVEALLLTRYKVVDESMFAKQSLAGRYYQAELGNEKNNLRNEYGRAPRSVAVVDEVKGRATAKMNFAGVILETGHLDALILPTFNINLMSIFLQEVSLQHPHEHLVIILDQAGWHTSPPLKLPPNLILHFLPPYSPQLNPVEHLLDNLRERWFSNRFFHSLQAVEKQLINALQFMMKCPEMIKSITSFSGIKT